jgi:hypothetical protein
MRRPSVTIALQMIRESLFKRDPRQQKISKPIIAMFDHICEQTLQSEIEAED